MRHAGQRIGLLLWFTLAVAACTGCATEADGTSGTLGTAVREGVGSAVSSLIEAGLLTLLL
jgi:hypothetical protein